MEPITIAASFATVVSLIGQYRSEIGLRKTSDAEQLRGWLLENQYQDIVDLLWNDSKTLEGIDFLLRQDHQLFLEKLTSIDSAVLQISSAIEGFDRVAAAVSPDLALSDQAVSILYQMENLEAEALLKMGTFGGTELGVIRGPKSASIDLTEPRFLDSDLDTLVQLGLLKLDYNGQGQPLYIYTRRAHELLGKIEKNS